MDGTDSKQQQLADALMKLAMHEAMVGLLEANRAQIVARAQEIIAAKLGGKVAESEASGGEKVP